MDTRELFTSAVGAFARGEGFDPRAPMNFGGRGEQTGMQEIRKIVFPAQAIQNDFSGFPRLGVELDVPYPVIVQAQSQSLNGSDPNGAVNFIYAVPRRKIAEVVNSGFLGQGTGGHTVAIRSTNGGTLYLPAGDYVLYYPDTNQCTCGVFDARDPIFAAWMLSLPGSHVIARHPVDIVLDDATPNTVAMPANRWRKWFTIQNTTYPIVAGTNQRIRVGFNTPPSPTRGQVLEPGQAATYAGDLLLFYQVQIIREYGIGAGGPTLTFHLMEVQ